MHLGSPHTFLILVEMINVYNQTRCFLSGRGKQTEEWLVSEMLSQAYTCYGWLLKLIHNHTH